LFDASREKESEEADEGVIDGVGGVEKSFARERGDWVPIVDLKDDLERTGVRELEVVEEADEDVGG